MDLGGGGAWPLECDFDVFGLRSRREDGFQHRRRRASGRSTSSTSPVALAVKVGVLRLRFGQCKAVDVSRSEVDLADED